MKLLSAALLAVAIASGPPAGAEIDPSLADARLIGMPIYTSDGLLIGQVIGVETYGSNRSIVGAVGGLLGFDPAAFGSPSLGRTKRKITSSSC